MQLIKLDAIDSTNDFLKAMANDQITENFTVVTAENQTKGKGQMGAKWSSETGKNLIMSILIKDVLSDIREIYNLNVAVSVAVIAALEKYNIPKLSIKWPNDIMADSKKIGGILIENTIKSAIDIVSVVGIGLNVNQKEFSNLPKASSLSIIVNADFDKDLILAEIVKTIKTNVEILKVGKAEILWKCYSSLLFKVQIPMPFQVSSGKPFMGIIQGVSEDGKLQLLLEDDSIQTYEIKEIQMLY